MFVEKSDETIECMPNVFISFLNMHGSPSYLMSVLQGAMLKTN